MSAQSARRRRPRGRYPLGVRIGYLVSVVAAFSLVGWTAFVR